MAVDFLEISDSAQNEQTVCFTFQTYKKPRKVRGVFGALIFRHALRQGNNLNANRNDFNTHYYLAFSESIREELLDCDLRFVPIEMV